MPLGEIPIPPVLPALWSADGIVLVVGVTVDWCAYDVKLDLLYLTDGANRSGFAPAGAIDSYVDNGAGAGDLRYELVIDTGHYSAVSEATFFLAGYRVELREWDADIGPTSESRVVSPAGNVGSNVYLTAAPSAAMQAIITAGHGLLTLDEYDTASQNSKAQLYLHVADDADDLIGTSGVPGFKIG
jgi:hypothetical protein